MSDAGDNDSPEAEPSPPADEPEAAAPLPAPEPAAEPPSYTGAVEPTPVPTPTAQAQARLQLTGAEKFWYVLFCIYFGAGYLAKVPTKKALSEVNLIEMTEGEKFWYVVLCICFGAGYLAKVPTKRALTDAGRTQMTAASASGTCSSASTSAPDISRRSRPRKHSVRSTSRP